MILNPKVSLRDYWVCCDQFKPHQEHEMLLCGARELDEHQLFIVSGHQVRFWLA